MTQFKLFILFVFFFVYTNSYADFSDYTSLFQIPQTRTYCSDKKTNLKGRCITNGRVSLGTCGKRNLAKYPYRCSENMTGFKNLYDFSDPRICSQTDSGVTGQCDKKKYRISAVAPQKYGKLWGACGKLSAFRLFIPPGTTNFNLTLYVPRDDQIAMVARYKQIPECKYCKSCRTPPEGYTYTDVYENLLPVSFENDIVLDEEMASLSTRKKDILSTQDVYQTNMGGHIMLSFGFSERKPLSEDRAGWLFIKMIPCRNAVIASLRFTVEVDAKKYNEWFSNAKWDIKGDPIVDASQVVIPPKPTIISPEPVVVLPEPTVKPKGLPPQVFIGETPFPVKITKQNTDVLVCIVGGYAQHSRSELYIWREENGKTYCFDGNVWSLALRDSTKCKPLAVMSKLPHHICFKWGGLSKVKYLKDCTLYIAIDDVIDGYLTHNSFRYGKQKIKIINK